MKSSIVNGESRGSVPNILLKALQSGDKYGYEINKEIETKSKGKYFLKEASLYSGLKRLEASNYITSYWKDGELGIRRHYYSITPLGIEKLNNSKFTWDDSKNFMIEIFNDYKTRDSLKNDSASNQNTNFSQQNTNFPTQEKPKVQDEVVNQTLNTNTTPIQEQKKVEVKKNPFQIEVNPLQQSIFDMNFSTEKQEDSVQIEKQEVLEVLDKQENNQENAVANDNTVNVISEIKTENLTEIQTNENKNEIINEVQIKVIDADNNNEKPGKTEQISYEALLNSYNLNSYSENLNVVKEKIDISKYLTREKENDSSIIISNENNTITEDKNNNSLLETNEITPLTSLKVDETTTQTTVNISDNSTEKIKPTIERTKTEHVDIKNIFGNLLVDEKEKEEHINQIELPVEEENTEIIERPALPRINVDDDVNIMFNSNSVKTKNNIQETISNAQYVKNNTSNSPTVRQYINNVHKKTLISRATSVEQEVNLEGINIREYQKMNNKIIKNSNYAYINKLNFFLILLFASIVLVESIVSFVIFNANKCLGVFEILLLSSLIIISLLGVYFASLSYFKDKFKVELKNYNFKTNIFYLILIFVVVTIILICINIFQGMNTHSFSYFVTKIIMEILISSNLVLIPVVKLWFYNLKFFSN